MKKYNFNAGPSILPDVVLEAAAKAIIDFDGTGLSLLSISHRTPEFEAVLAEVCIKSAVSGENIQQITDLADELCK